LPEPRSVNRSQASLIDKSDNCIQLGLANRVWCTLLLIVLAISTFSQSADRLHTFFKQNISLKDSEIANIDQGKAFVALGKKPAGASLRQGTAPTDGLSQLQRRAFRTAPSARADLLRKSTSAW
jgi:hypothetical protein